MARVEIWVDHLEALAHAARVYDKARKEMNADLPGNFNDLEFLAGPVEITLDGLPTGWKIDYVHDATHLAIEEPEPVVDEPMPF